MKIVDLHSYIELRPDFVQPTEQRNRGIITLVHDINFHLDSSFSPSLTPCSKLVQKSSLDRGKKRQVRNGITPKEIHPFAGHSDSSPTHHLSPHKYQIRSLIQTPPTQNHPQGAESRSPRTGPAWHQHYCCRSYPHR